MKTFIAAIALLALGCFGGDAVAKERDHSLVPGAWAIQFGLEDNIGLKAYDGLTIALKRQRSDRSALRLGVRLKFDVDDDQSSHTSVRDSLTFLDDRDQERHQLGVDLHLIYQRYTNPGQAVNWFWGVGPTMGFERVTTSSERRTVDPGRSASESKESEGTQWSIGALATAGAEWFATSYLSFHAEYRASFARVSSDFSSTEEYVSSSGRVNRGTSSSDDSSWTFDGVQVLFGLSAYF